MLLVCLFFFIGGNEVMSNLPLQMSLFFNLTFFPVWILVMAFYFKNEVGRYITKNNNNK